MSALVLWSGGLDSTLALYRAVTGADSTGAWSTYIHKDGRKYYNIRTLTVSSKQIAGQRWLPRARKAIAKAFGEAGLPFHAVGINFSGEIRRDGVGSIQPALWVALGSLHLRDDEDLHLGWNKEEQRNRSEAQAAFDALQRLSGKTGKLVFPLEHHTKADVIVELGNAKAKGLVAASWWCEGIATMPAAKRRYLTGKPCGVCVKCEEITTARFRIAKLRREHDVTGQPVSKAIP